MARRHSSANPAPLSTRRHTGHEDRSSWSLSLQDAFQSLVSSVEINALGRRGRLLTFIADFYVILNAARAIRIVLNCFASP
jgi:hypothetical protein